MLVAPHQSRAGHGAGLRGAVNLRIGGGGVWNIGAGTADMGKELVATSLTTMGDLGEGVRGMLAKASAPDSLRQTGLLTFDREQVSEGVGKATVGTGKAGVNATTSAGKDG